MRGVSAITTSAYYNHLNQSNGVALSCRIFATWFVQIKWSLFHIQA